jgi:hypothetical protein
MKKAPRTDMAKRGRADAFSLTHRPVSRDGVARHSARRATDDERLSYRASCFNAPNSCHFEPARLIHIAGRLNVTERSLP